MKQILLLFTLLIIIGCSSSQEPAGVVEAKYSYLALGDSYTVGESVPIDKTWPVQLTERLRQRGFAMAAPLIVAKTGWTTSDLIRNIESEVNVQRDFDLVSVLIGVNNQYQGKPVYVFEEELREIFRKAIFHSKRMEKGVFALSIPDYGATPFGSANSEAIGEEIDIYNAIYRRIADEFGVAFYDITPISREAANNPALTARDNLHPSGLMYEYWVDQIIEEVAKKLPQ